jgi:hypothetical protein
VAVYGVPDLKPKLDIDESAVQCPVRGCPRRVARQRHRFAWEDRFVCQEHGICISPTTWKYPSEADNLLWTSSGDEALLTVVKGSKRESRIAFDNSEDAVTFNVFRFLETRPQLLEAVLAEMGGERVRDPRLVYWSHDQKTNGMWAPLKQARKTFGEPARRGSEPDLIVIADDALFFIEAKLTSTNKTSAPKSGEPKLYLTGGGSLFERAFTVNWTTVAASRYELMRFWLLGSWLAADLGLKFRLVSLLPLRQVQRSPAEPFADYAVQSAACRFGVYPWEHIWRIVARMHSGDADGHRLEQYFVNKSIGYNSRGVLQPAFLRW